MVKLWAWKVMNEGVDINDVPLRWRDAVKKELGITE